MIYKTIDEWIEHNPNHRGLLPIEVCHQIWGTKDNEKPWIDLTKEECFELCVKHKDESFSLLVAVQDKLKEKNNA